MSLPSQYRMSLSDMNQTIRFTNGNAGIGTTSPSYKLDVLGDLKTGTSNGSMIFSVTNTGNIEGRLDLTGGTTGGTGTTRFFARGSDSNFGIFNVEQGRTQFRIVTSTSGASGDIMSLLAVGGNVGIGTGSPGYKLHVVGDINYTGNLYQNGTLFSGGGGSQWTTSSSNIFYTAGNVGIGTTNPTSRLYISDTTSNPFSLILDGTSKTTNNGITINAATGYIPFINFQVNGSGPNIAATATQLQITQSASHTTSINPNGGLVCINTTSALSSFNSSLNVPSIQIGNRSDRSWIINLGGSGTVDSRRAGIFYGDGTNMFIVNQEPGYMIFNTHNTDRMIITSTGNVGVGTSSPGYTLDVNGDVMGKSLIVAGSGTYIPGSLYRDANWGMIIRSGTNNPAISHFSVADFSDNKLLHISATNGNVGIGTVAPTEKIHAIGNLCLERSSSASENPHVYINFAEFGFNDRFGIGADFLNGGNENNFYITSNTNGSAPLVADAKITLNMSGNVGIGTTSPVAALHVASADVATLLIQGDRNNTEGYDDGRIASQIQMRCDGLTSGYNLNLYNSSGNQHQFAIEHISSTTVGSTRVFINNSGDIGIGTTDPSFKLDVSGTIRGSSSSSSYPFNFITSNSSGQSNVLWMGSSSTSSITQFAFGTAQTTYNAGEIQFNSSYGAGSSSNFLGLGVWGNASQLIVNGSGNIGIGTTAPSQRLHINGNIQMETGGIIGLVPVDAFVYAGRTIGNYAITWAVTDNGANTTHISGWAGMNFFTGSASRMVINSSGYIGIGTTAPGNILQVGGGGRLRISNGATDYTLIGTENVDGGTNTRIVISGNTRSGAGGNIDYLATNTGSHNWYTTNSTTFRMILTSAGNVGIGTASPTALLNVNGNAIIENGLLTVRNNGGYGNIELKGDTGSFIDMGPDSIDFRTRIMHHESDRRLEFQVNGGTVAMTLTSAGNVNCGNTIQAGTVNATYVWPTFLGRQFDNRAIAPSNTPNATIGFGFGSYNNNNTGPFSDVIALNTYIDGSGGFQNAIMLQKYGIAMRVYQESFQSASAYSTYKEVVMADANGTTTITGSGSTLFQLNSSGRLSVLDDVIAFASFSDERLKTEISDLSNDISMEIVNSLRPVSFRWKDTISNVSKRGTDDVGFIAQEVEAVTPYAVDEFTDLGDNNEYKRIKYERLIPYLVGSIQKLTAQLKEYKDELDFLKSKLA